MTGQVSDEELFQRYRDRDDAAAFAAIYDRYDAPVFGFLRRFLRDSAAAEDLVQQTFLRIHEARGTFDPRLSLRTWIFTIARRLAINLIERERRVLDRVTDEHADAAPSPEQQAATRSEVRRLERALAQLAHDDAILVLFAKFEGLTSDELGHVLGCSADAAKMRLHRALRRLGELLGAELGDARVAARR